MPRYEQGIAAYLKRIKDEATGKRFPAQDIDDQRWNTERTHSVWKKDAPDHIDTLDWWIGLPGREIPVRLYCTDSSNPILNPKCSIHWICNP